MHPIATATTMTDAQRVADELNAAKIPAETVEEKQSGQRSFYTIIVEREDDVAAKEFLAGRLSDSVESRRGLIACPSCASYLTEFPERPHSSPSAAVAGAVLNAVAKGMHTGSQLMLCHACSFTWRPEDQA